MATIGFHASHEQFSPGSLLTHVQRAEQAGFHAAMCSDHYHPWSERQGQSGFAWSWLGAAMQATRFSYGVVCAPGQRYHPAIIAQAAAASTGTVDRVDGKAHVTVSRRCNATGVGRWEASLRQRVGETFVARSSIFRRAACGTSSSDLTLTFPPRGDIAFVEGPATVSLRLLACSRETGTCTRRSVTDEVALAFP